jgi:hypothetical protein
MLPGCNVDQNGANSRKGKKWINLFYEALKSLGACWEAYRRNVIFFI